MSETRLVRRDELLQGDKCGGVRGRQPNGCFLDEAIYAGLRPADVLVYVKRSQGRANRPYQKRSTVAAKSAAFCKSNSEPLSRIKSQFGITVQQSNSSLRCVNSDVSNVRIFQPRRGDDEAVEIVL